MKQHKLDTWSFFHGVAAFFSTVFSLGLVLISQDVRDWWTGKEPKYLVEVPNDRVAQAASKVLEKPKPAITGPTKAEEERVAKFKNCSVEDLPAIYNEAPEEQRSALAVEMIVAGREDMPKDVLFDLSEKFFGDDSMPITTLHKKYGLNSIDFRNRLANRLSQDFPEAASLFRGIIDTFNRHIKTKAPIETIQEARAYASGTIIEGAQEEIQEKSSTPTNCKNIAPFLKILATAAKEEGKYPSRSKFKRLQIAYHQDRCPEKRLVPLYQELFVFIGNIKEVFDDIKPIIDALPEEQAAAARTMVAAEESPPPSASKEDIERLGQ